MNIKNKIEYVSRYFEQEGEKHNKVPKLGHFERIVCLEISNNTLERITYAMERFIEQNDDASRIMITADIINKLYEAREKASAEDFKTAGA